MNHEKLARKLLKRCDGESYKTTIAALLDALITVVGQADSCSVRDVVADMIAGVEIKMRMRNGR